MTVKQQYLNLANQIEFHLLELLKVKDELTKIYNGLSEEEFRELVQDSEIKAVEKKLEQLYNNLEW